MEKGFVRFDRDSATGKLEERWSQRRCAEAAVECDLAGPTTERRLDDKHKHLRLRLPLPLAACIPRRECPQYEQLGGPHASSE